jgi:hypothetical protein
VGGTGYQGYRWLLSNIGDAQWNGKWMCHAAQEEMMQVDFQFDAEEGSLRMSLWKLVNPVYRFLTAGGMAPEEIMYCGRSLNMARYYSSYRDGWQESTDGTQYSCYPRAFFLRRACEKHLQCL